MRHRRDVKSRERRHERLLGRAASARERAAFHEAGHVVGWLSAPFEPPDIYGITIEPDGSRGLSGEVRHRLEKCHDALSYQLAVGRALSRGSLTALASLLAEMSAQVRAHAAGPVAEAMRIGVRVGAIDEGACDYWNAYELCATVGVDPERTWRAEARRARAWLRRQWDHVEHLATLLLRQRAGRRMLVGAPLKAVIRRARGDAASPYGASSYRAEARALLAGHRARWGDRLHWAVMEIGRPRSVAVAWAEDAQSAAHVAGELAHHAEDGLRFEVQRRRPRV